MSGRPKRIIVLNCIKIGRSIAAILRFCKFSKWRPPPSWIFEIVKFYYNVAKHHWTTARSAPNKIYSFKPTHTLSLFNCFRYGSYGATPHNNMNHMVCQQPIRDMQCSAIFSPILYRRTLAKKHPGWLVRGPWSSVGDDVYFIRSFRTHLPIISRWGHK